MGKYEMETSSLILNNSRCRAKEEKAQTNP
jgi:hypothetical protein